MNLDFDTGTVATAAGGAALVLSLLVAAGRRRRRHQRVETRNRHPVTHDARPTVRVLRTDDELQAAVDRAVVTERNAAARAAERAARIERLAPEHH